MPCPCSTSHRSRSLTPTASRRYGSSTRRASSGPGPPGGSPSTTRCGRSTGCLSRTFHVSLRHYREQSEKSNAFICRCRRTSCKIPVTSSLHPSPAWHPACKGCNPLQIANWSIHMHRRQSFRSHSASYRNSCSLWRQSASTRLWWRQSRVSETSGWNRGGSNARTITPHEGPVPDHLAVLDVIVLGRGATFCRVGAPKEGDDDDAEDSEGLGKLHHGDLV